MGKKTRNPKKLRKAAGPPPDRPQYTIEERKDVCKGIVESLTENGLTPDTDPGVGVLLAILSEYQNTGDRQTVSIPIIHDRAEIYGVLPKYKTEEPAVGVRPVHTTSLPSA